MVRPGSKSLKPVEVQRIPKLRAGDHLTAAEFERRWEAMPELKKAELINGIVYLESPEVIEGKGFIAPPVSHEYHGGPHADLVTILSIYRSRTPGVIGGDNATNRLDEANEPQPDCYLLIDPKCGGQAKIDEQGYIKGATEFIAEVAYSSVNYDLHEKMQTYRRFGVREYLIWQTEEFTINLYALKGTEYREMPDQDGVFKSEIFPGLWIDANALLQGNLADAIETLQKGVATPEHEAFVKKLAAKKG